MTDSDLTIDILKDIRDDIRKTNARLDTLTEHVQVLTQRVETGFGGINQRVDALSERLETGFADVNRRLDGVLAISGGHHAELESRVRRIEDHLQLPPP